MSTARLDLREDQHPKCGGKNCQERDNVDADGLCTHTVSARDSLPVRCVGEWAYDKIYRLVQYFGTFAGGMSKKWQGLNYVEICSGPGRCTRRGGRSQPWLHVGALRSMALDSSPNSPKGVSQN